MSGCNLMPFRYLLKDPDEYTLADLDPEFVRVQTLIKGQVFVSF